MYSLDERWKWQHGRVHAEYPKTSGSLAQALSTLSSALLANPAPNISVVIESMTGSGCYRSIRDNQSDVTPLPIGYPIKDFDRVNPVQVFFERPLSILSSHKVVDKYSIIYADILKTSLRSFDFIVWSAVVSMFIFVGLLFLRQLFNSVKKDKKQENDSPFFETFSEPTLESGQSSGSQGFPVKFPLVFFGLLQL